MEAIEQTVLIAPGAIRGYPSNVEIERLNLLLAAVVKQVLAARVMPGFLPEEPE